MTAGHAFLAKQGASHSLTGQGASDSKVKRPRTRVALVQSDCKRASFQLGAVELLDRRLRVLRGSEAHQAVPLRRRKSCDLQCLQQACSRLAAASLSTKQAETHSAT